MKSDPDQRPVMLEFAFDSTSQKKPRKPNLAKSALAEVVKAPPSEKPSEATHEPEVLKEPADAIPRGMREEMEASIAENRRNSQAVVEVLEELRAMIKTMSADRIELPAPAKSQAPEPAPLPTPPPAVSRPAGSRSDLIELADQVHRLAAGLSCKPGPARSWWPWKQREAPSWRAEQARVSDALSNLSAHVQSLLKGAGLERIPCENVTFDPACMRSAEAVFDPSVPDHTVLVELLPGWREVGSGRVIRPASVHVSRARSHLTI